MVALAAAGCILTGCSRQAATTPADKAPAANSVKITQFYASQPSVARGEKTLLCYGVENAKMVRLSPPPQELSAALTRCVEVNPAETTTYTLTAEGDGGATTATQTATVTVGAARAKIVNVTVSALTVKRGASVSICYNVNNVKTVLIEPLHFRAGSLSHGCTMDQPQTTTTYVISALGEGGDKDQERVTVKVQ